MNLPVKICGITRPEDGCVAADLGAWAIGLVFWPPSPRCLTLGQAKAISAVVPRAVRRVGVFLDQPLEEVQSIDREMGLDLIQLHGIEGPAMIRQLGPERVIKAFILKTVNEVSAAMHSPAQYILIDRERLQREPNPVDPAQARFIAEQRSRMILAGALSAENVSEAIRSILPWGVDVSSSLETSPGVKDPRKMEAFFKAINDVPIARA